MKALKVNLDEEVWLWMRAEATRQKISFSGLMRRIARAKYMPEVKVENASQS